MAKYLDQDGLSHFWDGIKTALGKKADVSSTVSSVVYDTTDKKLTQARGEQVLDIVTVSKLKEDMALTKADVGLSKAENTADAEKFVAGAKTAEALVSDNPKPATANEMHDDGTHRVRAFLATASMSTGKPPVDAHILHFNWDTGANEVGTRDSQLAIASGTTPGLYFRTQQNGTWSNWISVYSSENRPDASDLDFNNVQNLTQKALHGGTALTSRTNLNTITTIGNYYAATNSIANSLQNCPIKKAFHMYVGLSDGKNTGYEYQEIVAAETGSRYYRRRKGNDTEGWTDWTVLTEYKAGAGIGMEDNTIFTSVTNVPDPAEGETVTTKRLTSLGKGKYLIEEYGSSAQALPSEHQYFLMTGTSSLNVKYGFQFAMNKNANELYYRRIYNSVYSSWFPLIYKAGDGLSLTDGTFANTGVRTLTMSEGTNNGQIAYTINGGNAVNVSVKGLGTAAFKNIADFSAPGHTHNYAGSDSVGGPANSLKNKLQLWFGTSMPVSGSGEWSFDATKELSIQIAPGSNVNFATAKNKVTINAIDTKYSAGVGLTLSENNVFTNSGVTSVVTGTENGSIKVKTNGTETSVKVKGLGDRAFDSTNYLPLTGGTVTGNVLAQKSGQIGFEVENTNTSYAHKAAFRAGSNGYAGIYDATFSKWLVYMDKSGNGILKGNADTATQFSEEKSVTLTGDVTGTASSKAGWSIATTLANTQVSAGTYGPSAGGNLSFGGSLVVPYFQVDAKGRLTSATSRTFTLPTPNTNYLPLTGGTLTGSLYVGASDGTSSMISAVRNSYSTLQMMAYADSTRKTAEVMYTPSGGSAKTIVLARYENSAYTVKFYGTADGVNIKESNRTVGTGSWVNTTDSNISGVYSKQATLSLTGVTADHVPIIAFKPQDIEDFGLAPVAKANAGSYTIYADGTPSRSITILSAAFV